MAYYGCNNIDYSGQSYKTFYACKLRLKSCNIGNFLVITTLVVIYEHRMFIRWPLDKVHFLIILKYSRRKLMASKFVPR